MTADPKFSISLDVDAGRPAAPARPQPERPFHILLLGDFAGSATRGELRTRRAVSVDRDNIDDVLESFRPSVRYQLGGNEGPEVALTFNQLDDFHPDHLVERVPLLQSLLDLRDDAKSGRARLPDPAPATARAPSPPRGGSLLDQIVEEVAGPGPALAPAPAPAREDELALYIRNAITPHLVKQDDPRQTALVGQIEETLAAALRAVLHHPSFQTLESSWRGVDFVTRRLETDAKLRVFLLDVTHAEVVADLMADRPLEQTQLYGMLVDRTVGTPGAVPWAVIAGQYTFADTRDDALLLARLGKLARHANAAFIAAAAPAVAGVDSFAVEPEPGDLQPRPDQAWSALRATPQARYIALAQPRLLLRLPYDPREQPIEEFKFQEMTSPPAHEDYLWGNPSLVCAQLLGEAFTDDGWRLEPGSAAVVDNVPLHLYKDGFETVAKPCAETLLTDRVAARLIQFGLTPLLSEKNGESVRLARFQSLAEPPATLAGPWASA